MQRGEISPITLSAFVYLDPECNSLILIHSSQFKLKLNVVNTKFIA